MRDADRIIVTYLLDELDRGIGELYPGAPVVADRLRVHLESLRHRLDGTHTAASHAGKRRGRKPKATAAEAEPTG